MQVMDKQKKRRTSTALLSASVFNQCFRFSFLGRRTVLFICLVREFSAYHAHICHLLDNHVPTAVKMTFTVILKVLVMMWFQSFSHMISPFLKLGKIKTDYLVGLYKRYYVFQVFHESLGFFNS